MAFGPEAGAVELLADAGKDAFSSATESTLGKITGPLTEGGDGGAANASDAADKVFSDLSTIQGRWSSDVTTAWNQSQQNGGTPGQVNPKDFPPVYYNGVQYTADPHQYEQQYGGNFLSSDGTVMDPSQMSAKAAGRVQRMAAGPGDLQRGGDELRGEVPGVVQQLLQLAAGRWRLTCQPSTCQPSTGRPC